MAIPVSSSSSKFLRIGDVFTPVKWGQFAITQFDIFDKWLAGATVFDPTMGSGNLLESMILYGQSRGYDLSQLPFDNLFGNELNSKYYNQSIQKFKDQFDLDMKNNFWNEDILKLPSRKFDVILGNPPWQNFVDLPEEYKVKIKSEFFKYDLVGNSQKLLLGGARIDLAALIIQKTIKDFLSDNSDAYFFMPLSLLLNDGANQSFRNYKVNGTYYSPIKVFDFNDSEVFGGVATRYGLVHFKRDSKTSYPIPYQRYENGEWKAYFAQPLLHPSNPLSILEFDQVNPLDDFKPIKINKESAPRQGINTGGANSVFIFDDYKKIDDSLCIINNEDILPIKYTFPLLTSQNFKDQNHAVKKWVLIPYTYKGRPLETDQLINEKELWAYLNKHKNHLLSRKGSLIGAWLKRGYWWALLGVGPYNFMPYKVVWEAYGKKEFRPIIVGDKWQVNQSLQAFIPTRSLEDAEMILNELKKPAVEAYLLSLKMEGTMNWAQPGKIKKLIQYNESGQSLFD